MVENSGLDGNCGNLGVKVRMWSLGQPTMGGKYSLFFQLGKIENFW